MELITRRGQIRAAVERGSLEGLDPERATADDVAAIVGNRSWTEVVCDECGMDVRRMVRLGGGDDLEPGTATICADCLLRAIKLLATSDD